MGKGSRLVFKELQAWGYQMSIGVINQLAIDFIAEKQNDKKYIQVCYSLGSEAAIERRQSIDQRKHFDCAVEAYFANFKDLTP